jgi:hypothetical protein
MNSVARAVLACAAAWVLVGAPAAHAGLVTFDDVVLDFQGDGGSVVSAGFRFTQVGDFGGIVDAEAFSAFGQAPTGNATQFYAGFNDSAVTMTREGGGSFRLAGLAHAFVAPLDRLDPFDPLGPGADPGALVLHALARDGAAYRLSASWRADHDGRFSFQVLDAGGLGPIGGADLRSLSFSACTVDPEGHCVAPHLNLNQFAIDDIAVAVAVAEPSSLALAQLALALGAGLGLARGVQRTAAHRGRPA